ncbi:MAG: hypothetical protein AB7F88_03520 [Pyrinomonadaceae bacterium]
MAVRNLVEIGPEKLGGTPVFRGTRVSPPSTSPADLGHRSNAGDV